MSIPKRMIFRGLRCRIATVALAATVCAGPVMAGPPHNITDNETAMLPSYCKDTQTWPNGNPDGMARGKARFGEVFWHFHHYCYAMVYMMRADRHSNSAMERRGNLASALDDIEYVLKYLPPDYFLLPEMYTNQAKVLRRQEKVSEAIDVLKKAIDLNPKYWRAYSELAQCYEALGDVQAARQAIDDGLRHNPESKVLTAYRRDLQKM
jgi:tetratricopeptide (TPR) repeat protein